MTTTRPVVALAACPTYEDAELDAAIAAVLRAHGGWEALFEGDPVVLLKPNFLAPRGIASAATTHPRFIAAVVRAVRAAFPGRLQLGDSPAVGSTRAVARVLGLPRLLAPYDVELVEFRDTVAVSGGNGFGPIELARPVVEADRVISLPKPKTHGQLRLTLAVKNLYGALVGFEKPRRHLTAGRDEATFARLVWEIERRVAPAFHLMDGVVGMEGNGPSAGDPRALGLVAASDRGLALDAVLAEILGYRAADVPLLAEALRDGDPAADVARVEVRGTPLAELRVGDWRPARRQDAADTYLPGPLRHLLTTRPAFDHARCTRCRQCLGHCAAGALALAPRGRRAAGPEDRHDAVELDLDRCIRCYCCQEVCPEGAIRVGEGPLMRVTGWFRRR